MRKFYTTILVMVVAVVMWSGVTVAVAEQTGQKERKHRPMVMTEERVEGILSRIGQTNPEKAEQLASLREKDPNEFQKQLREYFRQEFGERPWGQNAQARAGRGPRGGQQMMMPGMMGKGPMGEWMWKEHNDFMNWLTENYPDKAEQLQKLQQEGDMEAYFGQLGSIMRTYKPIMKASKRNPELAGVLKEDLRLKEQRSKLLAEIKAATDEGEKKQLVNQLEKVVADRFELIIKRKQIQYEELLQKLERLKEQVKERKSEVDSLKSQKADKVKERLGELLSGMEKVDWD